MDNASPPPVSRQRITSIDALRAFTLLGILIVHAVLLFGLPYDGIQSSLDAVITKVNELFLVNKCNNIFAALFGVSFYLILRNPKNGNLKFAWRCMLLFLIGLFNILFFTYDVLMLYGFWGVVLVLFRNVRSRYLLIICVGLLFINAYLSRFKFGDLLFGPTLGEKYGIDKSFIDVFSYPNVLVDYLHIVLNGSIFATLVKFIFGYWIAKIGFIEHLEERLTKRFLLTVWAIFLVLFFADRLVARYGNGSILLRMLTDYSGSAAYASALLYAYYHCGICNKILEFFESYGRLGLTNYSMGSIFGVIFINEFGLGLYKYPMLFIVLFFIGFFLLQAVFSYFWLRYFTYGPMEYVWRVATERKKIPFLRDQETRLKA